MPKMYANFSDRSYAALVSGEAVDNNGLRSPNGSFYPDQPSFEPIDERREQLQNAGTQLIIAAGSFLVIQVALPEIKRFTHEKIYPCVVEKWDEWRERCKRRKSGEQTPRASAEGQFPSDLEGDSPRVIKLESYRKEA